MICLWHKKKLDKLKPLKYEPLFAVFMIGLSCASLLTLSGGDMTICAITFIASAIAMFVRQEISKRHYNPLIVFCHYRFCCLTDFGCQFEI